MPEIINQPETFRSESVAGTPSVAPPPEPTRSKVIITRLSIIIPVYNEEKTIATVLDKINEVKLISNIEKEVIIVNDCSKDKTEEVILHYMEMMEQPAFNYFKYIKHEKN
jgi:cellulose synthase/poly-beta-1,6-N-acetylglucosamine synthase-like glycosyltransferase